MQVRSPVGGALLHFFHGFTKLLMGPSLCGCQRSGQLFPVVLLDLIVAVGVVSCFWSNSKRCFNLQPRLSFGLRIWLPTASHSLLRINLDANLTVEFQNGLMTLFRIEHCSFSLSLTHTAHTETMLKSALYLRNRNRNQKCSSEATQRTKARVSAP